MEQQIKNTGGWVILTVLALVLLTVLVAIGWYFLIEQVSNNAFVASLIAAFFAGTAIALLRVIAGRRAAQSLQAGVAFQWYYGWSAMLALFLISALGTVNAAFVLAEGASIVRQDINAVRQAYDGLSIEAPRRLPIASYDAKQKQINALLQQLWEEIYSPYKGNLCGVGTAANSIISRMQTLLPDMPTIRSSGAIRPCTEARARDVYSAYEHSAYATLAKDQAYLEQRGPERYQYLAELKHNYKDAGDQLNTADASLFGFMAFARSAVQDPLAKVAKDYTADRARYADLLQPQTTNLLQTVDITASQRLGSPAALWQIISKRIFSANAWVYLLFAFALDIGTTFLLTHIFVLRQKLDDQEEQSDPYRMPDANPGFLWVNPPSKLRLGR